MRRALVVLVAGVVAGCSGKSSDPGTPDAGVAPVIASFTASPPSVPVGVPTDLTWSWTFANTPAPQPACSIDHGVGALASGGSATVTLATDTEFVLTCTNAKGSGAAFRTVSTVPVAPALASFRASPLAVPAGVPTDVTWTWTYSNQPGPAPTCTVDGGVGGVTSGTTTSVTLSADTVFTLTCGNAGGQDTRQVTVAAVPPPELATFSASRMTVPVGIDTEVAFSWTYVGTPAQAPTCAIDHGIGEIASGATRTVNLAGDTVYTLTCTSVGGSDTAQLTLAAVVPPTIGSFVASPGALAVNVATNVTWAWTVTPPASCSIDGGVGAIASGAAKSVTLSRARTYRLTCTNGGGTDVADVTVAVNECAAGVDDCGPHARCVETIESYACACDAGYSGDGNVCSALVACDATPGLCDPHAACTGTGAAAACVCAPGWAGDGLTCERYRLAFVTSTIGPGNLGAWATAGGNTGAAAGDAICQAHAAAAGLAGTYVAWISDSANDAYCRLHGRAGKKAARCGLVSLPVAAGPWVRTDLLPFAPAIDRLLSPSLVSYHPAATDEHGVVVTVEEDVTTGTTADGSWWAHYNAPPCRDWTSSAYGDKALFGLSSGSAVAWTDVNEWGRACSDAAHLRCLEVGSGPALPTLHSSAKKAFVTSVYGTAELAAWPDAGGLSGTAAADAICRARARAGGLANAERFKAFISGDGPDTAANRITGDGPWVRLDGALVARDRADLLDGALVAPLGVTEFGAYLTGDAGGWTGATPVGGVTRNCGGWTVGTYPSYGDMGSTGHSTSWLSGRSATCNGDGHLFCFED